MGKRARVQQRHAQEQARKGRRRGPSVTLIAGVVIAITVAVAFVATRERNVLATGEVTVTGEPLPSYPQNGASDPAIGMTAPTITGIDLHGDPITLGNSGRPTIVSFLAHWCSHCNAELDVLIPHLAEHPLEGVDLVAVSTYVDAARENYPPSSWLIDRGWSFPTLLDSAEVAAGDAFGISGTPYWVYLDATGSVVGRWSGELTLDAFDTVVDQLKAS